MPNSYPIDEILPALKTAIRDHASVVLHAPPGAGKTTRVPLALLDMLPAKERIIMLEPRRIAVVSAARWMAQSLGELPGETIGYSIRFDMKTSEKTRIEVVTEGVLTRRIQSDPGLESASIVIFDEFHERSIHADLALALCLDIRKELRSDLKILVMSATLDPGPVSALLGGAPVISSAGRAFPVEERYFEDRGRSLQVRVTSAVRTALKETNGDILVFLPGAGEIRACAADLQSSLELNEERLSLHPLYGDLPFEEQERAILPSRDRRKIVLATNIAETSLTIEGVRVVIDSGLTRMLRYDPSSGMNRLVTSMVSRASADQRKGRAGRLGPGMCYRLYGSHDLREMLPFTLPEIMVSDLSNLCLELAVWGVTDLSKLSWIDAPPAGAWDSARGLLLDLGALDADGLVTPLGRLMVRFPLHPRLSRLMLRARELGCVRLGADLAALITERDLFRVGAGERMIREPDISERVEALRRGRKGRDLDDRADPSALRAVERTANQLLRLMSGTIERTSGETADPELISRLLLSAYPDRIGKRRDEGGGRYVLAQGRGVRLSLDSHLLNNRYLIAVAVDAGEGTEGFVHVAAPVSEEMIREECAGRIKVVKRTEWDRKEGRIMAANEERLGTLLLSIRPLAPTNDEAEPILCDAIKAMPGLLSFSAEARQFQGRVVLIRRIFPEEEWPDLSDERLYADPGAWLTGWFGSARSGADLQRLNLLPPLRQMLTRKQQSLLDERAPVSIIVPSNSRVSLDYTIGDQPVLAVKLQEMFGLADTPMIAGGRIRVLLHLLSPARRPVQITQDLKGFWNKVYPQVKKDLKGRYPKHPWPDDPWNAVPTRRAKARGT